MAECTEKTETFDAEGAAGMRRELWKYVRWEDGRGMRKRDAVRLPETQGRMLRERDRCRRGSLPRSGEGDVRTADRSAAGREASGCFRDGHGFCKAALARPAAGKLCGMYFG